ncbi:MAG: hypothetical protein H8D26_06745 [Methanomicrobia archaeon]|nr:hypothetical protein [Methanomicrobia archaeon]MBC8521670.1 hypothetical protein [Methanomicrobia archaeon]
MDEGYVLLRNVAIQRKRKKKDAISISSIFSYETERKRGIKGMESDVTCACECKSA